MYHAQDTIAAVASAAGGAARGVVRISGAAAFSCLQGVVDESAAQRLRELKRPHVVAAQLSVREGAALVPCQIWAWPTERSYTREPLAEIHTVGSPPLLAATLVALCRQGARLAEPGEFTLRAFLSGRIDLTQAEGVLGVIAATGEPALRAALAQLAGGLSRPLVALRDQLADLLAELEAGLDFVEEDIEFISAVELRRRLQDAANSCDAIAAQVRGRSELADLPRVAIVGAPNAGKSSLFNRLAGKERAIVSPIAGATRDYLAARVQFGEQPCLVIDTAGQSDLAVGEIDALAQTHSAEQQRGAEVQVLCVDGSDTVAIAALTGESKDSGQLVVLTKSDLTPGGASAPAAPPIRVNSLSGEGIGELRSRIAEVLAMRRDNSGLAVAGTALRAAESVRQAGESIARAEQLAHSADGQELIAAEVRVALSELGKVVGAVYTDDLLDRIFSRFCIGK
ncbi:MAG: 50S ribosome-binding GTPase [Pirellulales bacterium]|nr:50S ribosome-binding GTPase [Pirellulales bacterium]